MNHAPAPVGLPAPAPDDPSPTPPSRARRISRRTAWLVVVAWLLVVGALTSFAPSLDDVESNDNGNPPADSVSMRAADLAAQAYGSAGAPPAVVVLTAETPDAAARAAREVAAAIEGAALPAVTGVVDASRVPDPSGGGLVSDDGTAQLVVVTLQGSPGEDEYRDGVREIRTLTADAAGDDVDTAVTGPAGIVVDAVAVFSGSDRVLLLGTVGLVVVLLFAIYRSPVLVVVALLGVGVAMRLAEGAGALLADAGLISVSGQTASIMTVLLFGVGTDYALIIFARFREALAAHPEPGTAMAAAMRSVTGALLASVSSIVAAVLALLAAVTPTLHDFGPYLAVGVASMAAVSFTLTPALLVLTGRFAFWPRRARGSGEVPESRLWSRVAHVVTTYPRRVLLGGTAALLALSAGLVGVQQSFDMVSGFRIETESQRGQELVAASFGPGRTAPSQVLVHAGTPLTERQVGAVATALGGADGVASTGAVLPSTDGRTLSVDVVLDANPYGPEAMDLLPGLTRTAQDAAADAGVADAEVLVGGESSVAADTRAALDRDLVVVGVLMLLVVGLILGVVLRSLLAPLYLGLTLLLSYAATMGATALVALRLGGDLGIGNRVAVYVLVFLVALGVDYTIFMMTRYREELAAAPSRTALRTSIVRTGGVISSAGVILAGTFAVLMTQPIRELYQFGLAMAIGILLDTFVVRPLLVPAAIELLGRRALWPTRVRVE
ncbi:MAG: MMPL family transporter [Nocardioides sp.]|uniref:MMPL family transporter n=1 Tax=Nocardioides sp. TaxID=35761 RepID=UPI003EFC6DBF